MTDCHHDHFAENGLTRNQRLVLDALRENGQPITAYGLLDRLRDEGLRAPPQIYRALDKLTEAGVVHRIESQNAFVSCNHGHCGGHGVLFAVCDSCGNVQELETADADDAIGKATGPIGFQPASLIGEVHGLCAQCQPGTDGR